MSSGLYYTENGKGFPLILLHGNGESNEYFVHQKAFFAEKFRVIAVDTRGHGFSSRGNVPFTLQQFAADLFIFMKEKHIEKAHILGFSDGGNIALLFALAYPQKTASLIVNGANLNPRGIKLMIQVPIVLGYTFMSLAALFTKKYLLAKETLGLMVTQPHIPIADLAHILCPVLVIAGTNDMIRTSHTKLIASSLPHATLCVLPGNHFIAANCSTAFNEAVSQFLSEYHYD